MCSKCQCWKCPCWKCQYGFIKIVFEISVRCVSVGTAKDAKSKYSQENFFGHIWTGEFWSILQSLQLSAQARPSVFVGQKHKHISSKWAIMCSSVLSHLKHEIRTSIIVSVHFWEKRIKKEKESLLSSLWITHINSAAASSALDQTGSEPQRIAKDALNNCSSFPLPNSYLTNKEKKKTFKSGSCGSLLAQNILCVIAVRCHFTQDFLKK